MNKLCDTHYGQLKEQLAEGVTLSDERLDHAARLQTFVPDPGETCVMCAEQATHYVPLDVPLPVQIAEEPEATDAEEAPVKKAPKKAK